MSRAIGAVLWIAAAFLVVSVIATGGADDQVRPDPTPSISAL